MVDLPKLTQEQVDFYQKNGYIQIKNLLSREEAEQMKQVMVKAIEKYDRELGEAAHIRGENADEFKSAYQRVLNQKVNLWKVDEDMKRVVFDERFAEIARQLVGCETLRIFHDHALLKMPGADSKPTPWHQDTVYWPMNEDGALSIWIAFDDVDETNGCMSFIPETRNLGRLDPVDLVNPKDIIKQHVKGEETPDVRVMDMPMGSVTFHDGLTFHYAGANHSDKPRHALAIIYMPGDTTWSGTMHVVCEGAPLEAGKTFNDEDFPVLAKAPATV